MNTFQTVAELLNNTVLLHQAAAEVFARSAEMADNERHRMLWNHLEQRHLNLGKRTSAYCEHAPRDILETWLQYTLERKSKDVLGKLKDSELSIEESEAISQEIDDYLFGLFEEVARMDDHFSLAAAFQNLMLMIEEEKHKIAGAFNSLYDV